MTKVGKLNRNLCYMLLLDGHMSLSSSNIHNVFSRLNKIYHYSNAARKTLSMEWDSFDYTEHKDIVIPKKFKR